MKQRENLDNEAVKLSKENNFNNSQLNTLDDIDTLPFYELYEDELYEYSKMEYLREFGIEDYLEAFGENNLDTEFEIDTYYADEEIDLHEIDIYDWPQT